MKDRNSILDDFYEKLKKKIDDYKKGAHPKASDESNGIPDFPLVEETMAYLDFSSAIKEILVSTFSDMMKPEEPSADSYKDSSDDEKAFFNVVASYGKGVLGDIGEHIKNEQVIKKANGNFNSICHIYQNNVCGLKKTEEEARNVVAEATDFLSLPNSDPEHKGVNKAIDELNSTLDKADLTLKSFSNDGKKDFEYASSKNEDVGYFNKKGKKYTDATAAVSSKMDALTKAVVIAKTEKENKLKTLVDKLPEEPFALSKSSLEIEPAIDPSTQQQFVRMKVQDEKGQNFDLGSDEVKDMSFDKMATISLKDFTDCLSQPIDLKKNPKITIVDVLKNNNCIASDTKGVIVVDTGVEIENLPKKQEQYKLCCTDNVVFTKLAYDKLREALKKNK